jgi:hypothetical protein
MVLVSQSDNVPAGQMSNTTWSDGTVAGLARLATKHIPIAYLLDTPFPSSSVPDCVAGHLNNVGACNLLRSHIYLYPGRLSTLADTLKSARITTVDPVNWFCTSQGCPVIVGNILVYRDNSHVTATFSRWLAPMVAPLFVPRKVG